MKKYFFLTCLLFCFLVGNSQKIDINKVGDDICNCLNTKNYKNDSLLIYNCYLAAYLKIEKFPKAKAKKTTLDNPVQKYLTTNCPKFLKAANADKGDWNLLKKRPDSKLDRTTCREILSYKNLYYLESTGDSTFVTFSDGCWNESIKKDKYFSKCKMNWDTDCDFTLTFIDSNEPYRMKNHKKGTQFHYSFIEKTASYIVLINKTDEETWEFKLYYNK